ncbi:ras and EF-hand domain-containing protein isoform X2 [Denticeps clupeoides]|uniref:ras and EF-hand domain-containing protein isoform X2 n=1 Tax=Denticeps clupeoides TaxID=299321 RepID=UPI0010A30DEC|nr:ras and EF-hand domain-containing protein-like isoform X2 [Denticeps clupeoides]
MDTETPDLRRLFSACDVNRSGRIEFEDFSAVCRDLGVPAGDVGSLFRRFDGDADGSINFSDFSSRFHEVSETLDLASLGGSQRDAWQEFENTMDGDVAFYLPRLRDALGEMYQLIHSSSDLALLQQYEEFVQALVSEGRDHRLDSDQLETSLRRIEETTSNQLAELEEDLQLQLRRTEERVREEKRMEEMVAALQRKHDNEVTDLQAAVDRLYTYQEESELSSPKEDVSRLRNQMRELIQENDQLRSSLMKAQTNISVLQVELDKLKNAYTEQRLQHEQESDDLKNMVIEYQSYSNHIEILQEMNKKLYDSNDGLRSALASDMASSKRRLSPKIDSPARRMRPIRQSTLSHNRFASEEDGMDVNSSNSNYSHVASWADKYFDSGVALPMDVDGSMASGYDSDESRDSLETVHHSYSYVPSELETTDVKSEAEVSVAPSRVSSIASSIRRRLSAFPAKHAEADLLDSDGPSPMYRLVLAGDAGAGKSSFLLRLSLNEFKSDIQTTLGEDNVHRDVFFHSKTECSFCLGVDFQIKKMLVDGERTSLQIWDTAGQERFRSIARSYFRKAHGVLLLYDVTSESSFLNVREWMEQIQESTDGNIPTCVIGNKMDLRAERPEGSCVSPVHGEKLAMTYNALFCETSAKEGTNVVEAVLHLAREVKKHVKLRRQSGSQVKLSLSSGKKALNNCCGM